MDPFKDWAKEFMHLDPWIAVFVFHVSFFLVEKTIYGFMLLGNVNILIWEEEAPFEHPE